MGNYPDRAIDDWKGSNVNNLFVQLAGLGLLLAGLGLGDWLWIRPYRPLTLHQWGALMLVLLTGMGGLIGSPFWWFDEPLSFSWDLPPLASRMLAAAGWTFALAAFLALRRPTRERIRLIMIMLFVYLAPLAAGILLFHLDRFDWAAPITYAFFAIVLILVAGSTWQLVRPVGVVASRPATLTPGTRRWLWAVAVVAGVWGTALAVTDSGFSPLVWVWPGDLLSSRLIAVMLFTLTAGAIYSLRAPDTASITLGAWVVYGFGVALANGWNLLGGKPVKEAYLAAFVLLGMVSLWFLWRSSQQRKDFAAAL